MGDGSAREEPSQYPLDHRPQRTMLSGEACRPQLLEVLLHQTVERRLARSSRLALANALYVEAGIRGVEAEMATWAAAAAAQPGTTR
jgi:hypothetical protein